MEVVLMDVVLIGVSPLEVLCRAGDRVAADVSFLSIFGRGFCGGSVDAFASGGVSVARTFSNFGSGGVCGAGSEYCGGVCGAGIEEAVFK